MEAKFTKGEWLIEQCDLPATKSEYFNINAVSGGCIADTYDKHDAALIAIAPGLYVEIERDIEWLQRLSEKYVIGSYELKGILLRIQSKKLLLAKARGESNDYQRHAPNRINRT